MKSLLVTLLGVAVLAAPITDTFAQTGSSSSSSSTSPSSPASPSTPSAPSAGSSSSSSTTTTTETKSPAVTTPPSGSVSGTVKSEQRRDDGASALPRSSVSERTTIFGLSPTAAVLIAAALLLVVVLAIVAMTRSNGDYIDNRRM
jgi:GPI ethanolamine phosphate transferase 2/3 subunit F